MLDNKRFVKFKDYSGNQYFYDAWKNRIHHINDCFIETINLIDRYGIDEIVPTLTPRYSREEIHRNYRKIKEIEERNSYIQRLKERVLKNPEVLLTKLTSERFEEAISNIKQLTLEVTQACNFRCKYCVYSGEYQYHRTHKEKMMPFEIAQKSIDYFFSLVNSPKRTLRYHSVYFGFYGGEPLLAYELIEKCVEYIKGIKTKEKIHFTITTNGSLLNFTMIDFFIRNNFSIIISLDGPKEEHDKFRRFHDNTGTFDKVWNYILKIKERDEEYFLNNVSFASVYCAEHNLLNMERFFSKNFKINKVRISPTKPDNTNFYENLEVKSKEKSKNNLKRLNKRYMSAMVAGKPVSNFLNSLFSSSLLKIKDRDTFSLDEKLAGKYKAFGVSSTCFPGGEKLYVGVDGVFYICERVNQFFSIGDCKSGIDYMKVKKIVELYSRFVLENCLFCEARRFCNLCIAHHNKEAGFDHNGYCETYKKNMKEVLRFYVNLYLKNKEALFKSSIQSGSDSNII